MKRQGGEGAVWSVSPPGKRVGSTRQHGRKDGAHSKKDGGHEMSSMK